MHTKGAPKNVPLRCRVVISALGEHGTCGHQLNLWKGQLQTTVLWWSINSIYRNCLNEECPIQLANCDVLYGQPNLDYIFSLDVH